jgi:hypothetical protein
MLVIVVVNQSIMGRPPLQDNKLSTRPIQFQPTLRQCPYKSSRSSRFPRENRALLADHHRDSDGLGCHAHDNVGMPTGA